MSWKKKLLRDSRLYLIVDKENCTCADFSDTAFCLAQAGADIIQFRDKVSGRLAILQAAIRIRKVLKSTTSIFIMNDYVDIAKTADCDGVHLGQGDFSLALARKILGKKKIIGVSCASLKQAEIAQEEGADYLGVGPIFTTPTKPEAQALGIDLIRKVQGRIWIPFFVLGGITLDNVGAVIHAGAQRIACCASVCSAANPYQATEQLAKKIRQLSHCFAGAG